MNLSGNILGVAGATVLALSVKNFKDITQPNLRSNMLEAQGALMIASVAHQLKKLQILDLCSNYLGAQRGCCNRQICSSLASA